MNSTDESSMDMDGDLSTTTMEIMTPIPEERDVISIATTQKLQNKPEITLTQL